MAVYIDPPAWPAHGTTWSHLVSDESYDELHAFAGSLGLSRRMFDLDHYDVPERDYDRIVAAGAIAVPSRELVTRLAAAGLRVRPVDRADEYARRRTDWLRGEWRALGLVTGAADQAAWRGLGDELLARWSEPHRRYHDPVHLHDVLLALDQLADGGEHIAPRVRLAAWFHDAVYEGRPGDDERASAELARSRLEAMGLDAGLAGAVARLVLATIPAGVDEADADPSVIDGAEPGGDRPGARESRGDDAASAVLRDADLAILAAGTKRYRAYTDAVRAEYAHVPEPQFRAGRAHILQSYLDQPAIYRTPIARERWEQRARFNLAAEIATLTAP